jgi:hypothetical protein
MNDMTEFSIAKLIEQNIGQPKRLTLNLALPITDKQFDIGGTMIGIWDSPNANDTIQIRFNELSANQIPMKRQKVIVCPFDKVYITVPVGLAGNMEILYGSGTIEYFRMYPNVAEQAVVMDQIRDELRGDLDGAAYKTIVVGMAAVNVFIAWADRKGYEIQAGLGNTGNIYLGFNVAVTANNCFAALVAGQSHSRNDYRGTMYAIASAAGQILNVGEV